jgi:hypothetical protein
MKTCSAPVSLRNKAQSGFEVNLKLTCLLWTRLDSCTHVHPVTSSKIVPLAGNCRVSMEVTLLYIAIKMRTPACQTLV